MKRKIIKQGHNTLTITLPRKWCDVNNIHSGVEVDLIDKGKDMIISCSKNTSETKRVDIDVTGKSERVVRWMLSILNKKGYDEIYVKHDKDFDVAVIHELVKELYMGFAILEQTQTHCLLKAISTDNEDEFESTFRRALFVTLSMAESCYQCLKEGKYSQLNGLITLEHTNNQLTNFCERVINKGGYKDHSNATFTYVIVWNLEKVCDDFKYICDYFYDRWSRKEKITLNDKVMEAFADTIKYLRDFVKIYNSFDYSALNDLVKDKHKIMKNLLDVVGKSNQHSSVLAAFLIGCVLKITDFTPSLIAKNSKF